MNIVTRGYLIGAVVGILVVAALGAAGWLETAGLAMGMALLFLAAALVHLNLASPETFESMGSTGSHFGADFIKLAILVAIALAPAFIGAFIAGFWGVLVAVFRWLRDMG